MSALVKRPRGQGPFTVPAFLETDVLVDEPGTVGEQEEEGQVIKTGADGQRRQLKARDEEKRRQQRAEIMRLAESSVETDREEEGRGCRRSESKLRRCLFFISQSRKPKSGAE